MQYFFSSFCPPSMHPTDKAEEPQRRRTQSRLPHVIPHWPPESSFQQVSRVHRSKSLQDQSLHYDRFFSVFCGFITVLVLMVTLQFKEKCRRIAIPTRRFKGHSTEMQNGEIDDLVFTCTNCGNFNQALLKACIADCSRRHQAQHRNDGHKDNCIPKIQPENVMNLASLTTLAGLEDNPPFHLRCPITSDLFEDPVVAVDGETYERNAIEKWINEKKRNRTGVLSPMGFGRLSTFQLFPNRALYRLAMEWANAHHEARAAKYAIEPMFRNTGPSFPTF